jgi:hypothetical protein
MQSHIEHLELTHNDEINKKDLLIQDLYKQIRNYAELLYQANIEISKHRLYEMSRAVENSTIEQFHDRGL